MNEIVYLNFFIGASSKKCKAINPFRICFTHMETSQPICCANNWMVSVCAEHFSYMVQESYNGYEMIFFT